MLAALEPEPFPWLDYRRYSFSLGVRHGSRVWLSGNTASAFDPGTGSVGVRGGMATQAGVAWDKVEAVLAAAGLGPDAVTRVVEYVTADGLSAYQEAVEVRATRLGANRPAVATVVVERLVRPEALLEVEVTASGAPGDEGLVYLGSLTAPEAGDDLSAQVHAVLIRAGELLGAVGLGLGHVVKTVETTTPATRAAYRATAAVRRELLGPEFPAATGVLAPALERPGALVSIDVIASRLPKTVIDPDGSTRRGVTFSPAVRAGDVVFCSGATAIDPSTGQVAAAGDLAGQAEFVYGQLDGLLRAAGGSGLGDLVKTVEFVAPAGAGSYRDVAGVRERLLGRPFPASTGRRVRGPPAPGMARSRWTPPPWCRPRPREDTA